MAKKKPNFRKALTQMLAYIGQHLITVEDCRFVLSDEVMLKNTLVVKTLEEAGCIQRLGRLSHNLAAPDKAFGCEWQETVDLKFRMNWRNRSRVAWGRIVWLVNTDRYDQIDPQLLLSRPTLEAVEKLYGPQVDIVGRDDKPTDDLPWRAEPPG